MFVSRRQLRDNWLFGSITIYSMARKNVNLDKKVCVHHFHLVLIKSWFCQNIKLVSQQPSASRPAAQIHGNRNSKTSKLVFELCYPKWPETERNIHHLKMAISIRLSPFIQVAIVIDLELIIDSSGSSVKQRVSVRYHLQVACMIIWYTRPVYGRHDSTNDNREFDFIMCPSTSKVISPTIPGC